MIALWHRLAPRDRRALQLLAGVAIAALGWTLVIRPSWNRSAELRDAIAAERALLDRERALLARGVDSATTELRPVLFVGRDDAIAAAALAEHASVLAEAYDVWVQAAGTGETRPTGDGVRVLRVDVRAEGDVHGLSAWLAALERGAQPVRVATLEVSRAPVPDEGGTEPLVVRATLIGYAAPSSFSAWPSASSMNAGAAVTRARPDALAARVAARNPFSPTRQPPATRYRLSIPGDALAAGSVGLDDAPLPPVVLGTAIGADGASFAMCAIEGVAPTIVRVGDRLADFTVVRIVRGRVTFRDARGQRVDVPMLVPSEGEQP